MLIGLLISTFLSAQSVAKKIDSANLTLVKTNASAINAANTVTNTKNTVDYVAGTFNNLFKRKEKKEKDPKRDTTTMLAPPNPNVISINIAGINYDRFLELRDSIQAISGVVKITKKFNPDASNIIVYYTGKDDLWDLVPLHLQKLFIVKSEDSNLIKLEMRK